MNLLPVLEVQKKKIAAVSLKKHVPVSDITVMKFGGSSVGSAKKILHVAEVICTVAKDKKGVVVVSAMQGVTDKLITLFQNAKNGNLEKYLSMLQELSFHH